MAGFVAHPTLDGVHLLGLNPAEVEVVPRRVGQLVELAGGGRRWQGFYPGPGRPDVALKHGFRVAYAHLRDRGRLVEALLSRPGPHSWALWRHVEVSWTLDGSAVELELPWRLALDVLEPPPQGPSPERFAPWVAADPLDGAGLEVSSVETAGFDAGSPAAGAAWLERGGRRLKLAAPPEAGSVLYASVVPLFEVFEAQAPGQRLERVREPRTLILEEA